MSNFQFFGRSNYHRAGPRKPCVRWLLKPFNVWCPSKGHIYLNKPAGLFKCEWPFSGHQASSKGQTSNLLHLCR